TMQLVVLIPALSLPLIAQQTTTLSSTTVDFNGNAVQLPTISETKSKTSFDHTESTPSINGRMVPRERIEERVIREDASGRVVERIVRRYDQTGEPGPVEKTVTEEQKHPSGMTVKITTYRGDLNGNMAPAERSLTNIHQTASGQTADSIVERPTVNGG